MKLRMKIPAACAIFLFAAAAWAAATGAWLAKVPAADRAQTNPYAAQPEAAAAGKIVFQSKCAQCHGDDAKGRYSKPSLVSARVHNATDGELAWLLKNGNSWKGMPSWSSLPEQQRWQIITYLRTLPMDQ